ncbi:MAG TPA: hypothetical protein EYQ24_10485 [Bacteroidetes bacterium]|nr:hypothetical protein [Bacteroidota bacterium]
MIVDHIELRGSSKFLTAVFHEIANSVQQSGARYMGIIDNVGGGGSGGDTYDLVNLHLADRVTVEDARTIIPLALDRVAEATGLQQERQLVEMYYEDENEQDQPL